MPARFVIHKVGPVWVGGKNNEDKLLSNCYRNSLKLAEENKLRTIAFPSISTGAYGFPIEGASRIAVDTVREYLKTSKQIEKVVFACFSKNDYEVYRELLQKSM